MYLLYIQKQSNTAGKKTQKTPKITIKQKLFCFVLFCFVLRIYNLHNRGGG